MDRGETDLQRLMYRIAHAYYEQGLTQAQIAERFGISRIRVSRLLTRARRDGIVQINLHPAQERLAALERALERLFGLEEAVVADVPSGDYEAATRFIGLAAAQYVSRVFEDGHVLGLTWGNTVLSTVNAMPSLSRHASRAVQLLGGLGLPEADIHGAELVRRMAERLTCRPRNIHAPGIVPSRAVRDSLLADEQIADTLALARRADIALLGIGALGPHSVLRGDRPVLSLDDCRTLEDLGVVGDIALRFFNAKGAAVSTAFSGRVIGIDLDELRNIPRRVGVAGGSEKLAAIEGAVAGRYLTVLVTDAMTAESLVERVESGASKQAIGAGAKQQT